MNVSYQYYRLNDLVVEFDDDRRQGQDLVAVMVKQEERPFHVIGDHVERLHALRESWIKSNLTR